MGVFTKIAFGGGCHWCTEGIFQSLNGVREVNQGFIASVQEESTWSEAVIVVYDPEEISLRDLIAVHLHTHKSTVAHSLRKKYRSAIYFFDLRDEEDARNILMQLQTDFQDKLITKVLPFAKFKPSKKCYDNYYYSNPQRPFCKSYIGPKLKLLLNRFSDLVDHKVIRTQ